MRARSMALLLLLPLGCSDDSSTTDVGVEAGVDSVATCDPDTCAQGCCTADNQCVTTPSNTACGKSGGQCIDCTAASGTCTVQGNGAYCELPQACSASTCPSGCCVDKQCWTGVAVTVCGKDGEACADCATGGQQCQDQACAGTPTCTATSCASGCCRSGSCLAGDSDFACGTGGSLCLDCTGSGQTCGAQKTCQ